MKKKLSNIGSSLGLVIDKPIIELLHFTSEVELKITEDGKGLTIYPVKESGAAAPRKALKSSLERVNKKHGKVLKSLA
jgi:hypothetical protein